MAKKTKPGICHICLLNTDLTFEHVPPEAAFNKHRVQIVQGERILEMPLGATTGGYYQQRGAGGFTLCGKCNNSTGRWYVPAFIDWCVAGWNVLVQTRGNPHCLYVKQVYPLRIAKQILAMFCSIRGPDLSRHHPYLQKLLMDQTWFGIPNGLRIFVHYAIGSVSRRTGFGVPIKVDTGRATMLSELVFPPFGYLLTYGSEPPPDPRVLELTTFAFAHYHEQRTMTMNFPLLPTVSPFPGDYRTEGQMDDDRHENDLIEEARKKGSQDT